MTANEIFQKTSPSLASRLLDHLLEEQKPLYKAAVEALAQQRKLRPVYLERKPRQERNAWVHEALGRKNNDSLAAQLLQAWLVGAQSQLLCAFLDGLGIKHEEDGTVEELPSAPTAEKLKPVVEKLLKNHDQETVAVYLNAFQCLGESGWSTLAILLESDTRLMLPVS